MRMNVVRDAQGAVIHIGAWDLQLVPAPILAAGGEEIAVPEQPGPPVPPTTRAAEPGEMIGRDPVTREPILAEGGETVEVPGHPGEPIPATTRIAMAGELLGYSDEFVPANPLPDGATEAEEDIVVRDDGGLAAASDYGSLRRIAYPPLRDQLDALWKGGDAADAMRDQVLAVKTRFPKPQA